jgi:site-specific DNA recombinase
MTPAEPLFYERIGSGEDEAVPELARALEEGRGGQYDVLLVFHTSRFARNRAEAVAMKREFKRAGIVIYFTSQRLISGAFTSALSEGISEVLDEHENEQRRLWVAGGIRERQRSGRWHGQIPYGYRRVLVDFPDGTRGWDGGLEPDPVTAAIVRELFDRYVAGASGRSLALHLNVTGHRGPSGAPWQGQTIHKLLTNPVYTGRLVRYRRAWGRYYNQGDAEDGYADYGLRFPALIDDDLFAEVGRLIAGHRRSVAGRRHDYPLSSVLRCQECGYPMTGATNGWKRYYRCRGRFSFATCQAGYVQADHVEAQFAEWFGSFQLPADWRAEIARSRVRTVRNDEGDRQRRLAERLERIRKLYAWGEMPEAAFRSEATAIKTEMAVVAMPASRSLEDVAAALEQLGPAWRSAPPELQAVIPPLMLHAAEASSAGVEFVVRAELRPLLDMCVARRPEAGSGDRGYTMRYSA